MIISEFENRNLIHDISSKEEIEKYLNEKKQSVYCGFDPTAPSLQLGNLIPLIQLRRFQIEGHTPILLAGGATGMIGDPGGRTSERQLNSRETIEARLVNIKKQLAAIVDTDKGSSAAVLVDNYEWTAKIDTISFLRDIGKHFPLNMMLQKESVKSRLNREDGGISYTEFSYMLLQANDFLELSKRYGCLMQIGGSEQWGNITAGIELIRRVRGKKGHAFTFPLITKSSGEKFGKSADGALWLDKKLTSPYTLYQYFYNTEDEMAVPYLKYFTFLSIKEINALAEEIQTNPHKREAQKRLAAEVIKIVHGQDDLISALKITASLFSGDVRTLSEQELADAMENAPTGTLPLHTAGVSAVDLATAAAIEPSKNRSRELIKSGGFYVNGEKITDPERTFSHSETLHGKYFVLRKGKKKYHLIKTA